MAKDKITEYDATASNNTVVGDVNLAENSALPSDMNNAIREVMSHQKEAFGSGTPLYVDQTNNRVGVNKTPTVALDVSGQAIISTLDVTGATTLTGDLAVDTNVLKVDTTNNRVGINITSPTNRLHTHQTTSGGNFIQVTNSTTGTTSGDGFIVGIDSGENANLWNYENEDMIFASNNTERMRIKDNGNVLFATTGTPDSVADATTTSATGMAYESEGFLVIARAGAPLITNRIDSDGSVIVIKQEGDVEGTISVSGATTSYNAFSGSHWSRFTDNSKPKILKGTVIETIDEMCDWYQIAFTVPATDNEEENTLKKSYTLQDGQSVGDTITYNYNGTDYQATIIKEADNKHPKCKISDTADSKRIYGVFADWDNDDDTVNDMYVTAVGTHVVRINKDVTVQSGDLLSSNGDGTAKVQDDDIIRSKTIGKVLTNIKQETYDDGSYTVPCALYCG